MEAVLSIYTTSLTFVLKSLSELNQAHPWFKETVWDKLYEMEAAFKPEVTGELDTQNFYQFDEEVKYLVR